MPYRPHLVSSTTRPIVRPLVQKVFGDFDPLRLDPYLFFDAATSMVGTLENPTLDLDPSNQETLDVITATRAGVATYTDPDGNIATASADTVRVDYTQGDELTPTKFQNIGYTDFANASQWSQYDLSISSGQASPNGDNSAVKITATGNDPYLYTLVETSAQTHTFSFYCKGEGASVGQTARVLFWHITGVTTATGTTESFDFTLTDEWQRFEFQHTPTGAGTLYYRIDVPANAATVGNVAYIYGPQLEEGTTASDFVENTTGSPKFITGATYGPRVPMILVEPSATNKVPYSEDFSNSSWGKNDITISPAPVAAPDGTMNASHVVKTGANGHLVKTNIGAANTHTSSIWARTVSGSGTCIFTGNNGVISTVTEEWQRFEVASTNSHMYAVNFRGTSTLTEIYIWGAQLEEGIATSYIPTQNVPVTRAADDLVISGSAFSDFFNGTEGTVYAEFVPKRNDDYRHVYEFSNGTTAQRINLHLHGGSAIFYSQSSGATYVYSNSTAAGATTGVLHRSAFSYKTNDAPASFDGGAEIPDTEYSVPSGINRLYLGDYTPRDGNYILNGHIKRLIYWPYHSDSL